MLQALPSLTSGVNSVTRIMNSTPQHIRQCHSKSSQAAKVSVAALIQSHGHRFCPTDRHPTADQDPHGHAGTWRHVQLVKWHLDTPGPPTWILFRRKQSKIQRNFQQRKHKATADSERLHITFLANVSVTALLHSHEHRFRPGTTSHSRSRPKWACGDLAPRPARQVASRHARATYGDSIQSEAVQNSSKTSNNKSRRQRQIQRGCTSPFWSLEGA